MDALTAFIILGACVALVAVFSDWAFRRLDAWLLRQIENGWLGESGKQNNDL